MAQPATAANADDSIDRWLTKGLSRPSATWMLYCFPFAGGSAQSYWPWKDLLPQWIELCPLQPPGRGERLRETPCRSIDTIADSATRAIMSRTRKGRKIALFGHSLGSLAAFETSHRLLAAGVKVDYVFVSGRNAPHIKHKRKQVHDKPDKTFIKELQRYGGTPKEVLNTPELLELYLPTIRADFEIAETYECAQQTPLDVPMMAFAGDKDEDITNKGLKAWQEHTSEEFDSKLLPGGHFFLQEHRKELVDTIVDRLASMVMYV